MQQYLQNKKGLVQNVFDQVFDQYDLMNDLMSFGTHRIWKKNLIHMMNPSSKQKLIDVACGTGDIAKLLLHHVNKDAQITGESGRHRSPAFWCVPHQGDDRIDDVVECQIGRVDLDGSLGWRQRGNGSCGVFRVPGA